MSVYRFYVLLCNDDRVIFPIKAKWDARDAGKLNFCHGAPAFFGGGFEPPDPGKKRKRGPTNQQIVETLKREVGEESAETYSLNWVPLGSPVYSPEEPDVNDRGTKTYLTFYYSGPGQQNWQKKRDWLSEQEWAGKGGMEMCFVGEVSRSAFDQYLPPPIPAPAPAANLSLDQIYRVLIEAADAGWWVPQLARTPTEEYRNSKTSRAMVMFFNGWLNRTLPGWNPVLAAPAPQPPSPLPPPPSPPLPPSSVAINHPQTRAPDALAGWSPQ
jgi:hypothetical protein